MREYSRESSFSKQRTKRIKKTNKHIFCHLESHGYDKWIVYFYVVHSFEKEDFIENSRILSCFVELKSVLFN